jgi:hypothetical protein
MLVAQPPPPQLVTIIDSECCNKRNEPSQVQHHRRNQQRNRFQTPTDERDQEMEGMSTAMVLPYLHLLELLPQVSRLG